MVLKHDIAHPLLMNLQLENDLMIMIKKHSI